MGATLGPLWTFWSHCQCRPMSSPALWAEVKNRHIQLPADRFTSRQGRPELQALGVAFHEGDGPEQAQCRSYPKSPRFSVCTTDSCLAGSIHTASSSAMWDTGCKPPVMALETAGDATIPERIRVRQADVVAVDRGEAAPGRRRQTVEGTREFCLMEVVACKPWLVSASNVQAIWNHVVAATAAPALTISPPIGSRRADCGPSRVRRERLARVLQGQLNCGRVTLGRLPRIVT